MSKEANSKPAAESKAAANTEEKDRFITLSVMGEMYRVSKKQYNTFNEVLQLIAENVKEGVPFKDQVVGLRRQFVIHNGDKMGKVMDI